jgi:hypothetical protein
MNFRERSGCSGMAIAAIRHPFGIGSVFTSSRCRVNRFKRLRVSRR